MPINKAVILDYGEVIWLQSRNLHVYKKFEMDHNFAEGSLISTLLSQQLKAILPKNFQEDFLLGKYCAEDFDNWFVEAYNRKNGTKLRELQFFSATEYDDEAVYEEAWLCACQKLREHGIKTALLLDTYHVDSTKRGRMIPNMEKYFDVIAESCIEGIKKPNKKFYQICLDRLKVEASEVIFLDDNKANCDTAAAMGMRTIQVTGNTMDILEDLQDEIGIELD